MISLSSFRSDEPTTELPHLYVTIMVDWDMPSRVSKLEKSLKKAIKKDLKIQSISANRINTFMVIEAVLKSQPEVERRKSCETRIKQVLVDYAENLNQVYREELTYNGDSDIYYDAFAEQNLDLKSVFYNRKHGLIDDIEDQIEQIISTGSLIIWDAPGFHDDRIILPNIVATVDDITSFDENQLAEMPEIADLLDELIIANFASYFLPYTKKILHHAHVGIDTLEAELKNADRSYGDLSGFVSTERALRNFIGSISGLQESLKMLTREVSRLNAVIDEIEDELRLYPSEMLHAWLTSLGEIDCENIHQSISHLDQRIRAIKPQLRLLLKGQGVAQPQAIESLIHPIIELKAVSAAIIQFAGQFNDIPSFTTLSDGIAYESVEDEVYNKTDDDALLEVTKLFKMYRRGGSTVYALRGVDMTIQSGEFVIIQGPSGSGKTTLLNMLAGLDTPDRGAVFFNDTNINDISDRKRSKLRRENYSFIFQSYALIPHLNAMENAALPIEMGGLSKKLKDNVQNLLDSVGIGEYADHKPAHLSGGQMQRLGIARALANQPSIIFADEPTGDLDEKTGRTVMELLKRYHEETGVTIILVTHNPAIAEYGTRHIIVQDGQIIQ